MKLLDKSKADQNRDPMVIAVNGFVDHDKSGDGKLIAMSKPASLAFWARGAGENSAKNAAAKRAYPFGL